MNRRGLNDAEIEEIPSDYDEDTDVETDEEHEEYIIRNPLDKVQNLGNINAAVIRMDKDVLAHQITDDLNGANVNEENVATNRLWRKRPQCAIDLTALGTYFEFMNEKILDKIHLESNLKSEQEGKPAAITKDEIKVFIGVNMIMGFNSLPAIEDYWSSDADLEVLPIKNAMSRERFQTILSNLHVNDNSKINQENKDKLFKIRPLLDHLNEVFLEKRLFTEHLSIDKSMIRFKEQSSLKKYNPMKNIKRGYILWCLSDGTGYIYKTSIYAGKNESQIVNEQRKVFGLGGSVVLSLLKDVKERNCKVFFDDYFSSFPLMEALQNRQILACGTIRSNSKHLPKLCLDKDLKRGNFDYRSTPLGITVYKWMDNKAVHFISNYHGIATTSVQGREINGIKTTITCPKVVEDYNKHIGGVEKHDMLRHLFGTNRESKKWWHLLFFELLDMALVNAFILYSENNAGKPMDLFDYCKEVALGLLTYTEKVKPGPVKRRKSNYSTPNSVRLENRGIHWPQFTTSRGRCKVCSKNGSEARVKSKCSHCGVHLCCNISKNCFHLYHTNNYNG